MLLIRSSLLLVLPLATAWSETTGEVGRIAAPAAVYCTSSDSLVTMSWAKVRGASGYQVWEWRAESAAAESRPGWVAHERLAADRDRMSVTYAGDVLPRLAVSSLFSREDRAVARRSRRCSRPSLIRPGRMLTPLPPWALPSPDREEVKFGLYGKKREDALIDFIVQQTFRFPRWVFRRANRKAAKRLTAVE